MNISLKTLFFSCCVALLLAGCSSSAESGTESDPETTSEVTSEPEVTPTAVYAEDWGKFRAALSDRDKATVNGLMEIEGVTADDLLILVNEEVTDVMFNTSYDRLTEADWEGTKAKEFAYEETSLDEEGNEMGMALFFYFEERAEGLMLIGFLAAG